MYAVIRTGGKQYRVTRDNVVRVERIPGEVGSVIDLDEVLMLDDGTDPKIGTPLVEGARVVATVVDQTRAQKIIVFKKKRRKKHRKRRGHRQELTVLRITDIVASRKKPAKAEKEAPSEAAKAKAAEPKETTADKAPETKPKETKAARTKTPKAEETKAATAKAAKAEEKKAAPKAKEQKDSE